MICAGDDRCSRRREFDAFHDRVCEGYTGHGAGEVIYAAMRMIERNECPWCLCPIRPESARVASRRGKT